MDSLRQRAQEGLRLLALGMGINLFLAAAKLLGGWLGSSQALLADGMESSLDVLSSLMTWFALKYAERPPDQEHPYGHGKMESLAAVMGSLFLLLAGLALGAHSVEAIYQLHRGTLSIHGPATFTLVILVATIILKEFLFRWLSRRSSALGSKAIETDALHHRSDALTSLSASIGITATLIGGPSWAVADNWAALFSCSLIVFNGLRMLRGSIGEILDEQIAPEQLNQITAAAREVPGVSSVEKCRVRKSGLVRLADLHIRVPGDFTVYEGHRLAHQVKDRLLAADLHLTDVTVHVEPE